MPNIIPFLLRTTEQAFAIGNTLILPSPQLSPTIRTSATSVAIERILFAYRIPHLPDFITSPHLTGTNEHERIVEILDRQVRLIANLSKWKGMGFSIRYSSIPEQGKIELVFIARGLAQAGHGQQLGEQMIIDMTALLRSTDLPIEPITDESILHNILEPFQHPALVEIRQRENVVPLTGEMDAYVVYPFRPALSTWISSFNTLLEQRAPCVINIYLEPTRLYAEEQQSFALAAQIAESLANFQFEGMVTRFHIANPQARLVGRLYADYLSRLHEPFLLVAQITSPDPLTARSVAQTLGTEMTEPTHLQNANPDSVPLPSGFDVVSPTSSDEFHEAWRAMSALDLRLWGITDATSGKERLRYLVDARGASAAFRFPIAVRGGIPGIKTRQLLPTYETGARVDTLNENEIALGEYSTGGLVSIPINILTRHALIAGTTGSGKTTTCFCLLIELWKRKIHFLVIDPAKTEYRALIDSPIAADFQIFTLGVESVSPFRMNPLEILPGVRVESHISALRACFESALPTFGILPSLIEESLHAVYLNKKWNLTDRGKSNETRMMPTLGELYHEIIRTTEERGYSDKTLQDIRAAAAGRIGTLLHGSKGRMLNTRRSVPMDTLMTRPTLLELEALNDEEKSLVMLFLLTRVREYVRVRGSSGLAHITLIEEAHRLAAATAHATDRETSPDTRASGAEALSMTLSEIRAYGEGLIIAEQIPGRLVADALKNTNLKIVHRLPGKDDREMIGATMNLGIEQESFLSKLKPWQAAFFTEGFEKPSFINVPNYRAEYHLPDHVDEDRIEQVMQSFRNENPTLYLPFDGCTQCMRQCDYRDRVTGDVYDLGALKRFEQVRAAAEEQSRQNETAAWEELAKGCYDILQKPSLKKDEHAAYCVFVHLRAKGVNTESANKFRQAFHRIATEG